MRRAGRRAARRLGIVALASGLTAGAAGAEERVRVAASERYRAGRVHRFMLGGGYRDLWQAPIELPVLDLDAVGGGLTPTRRFGGLQTAVLGFSGADGRLYSFRGTDKDPSAVLAPALRDTVIRDMVQDQMAAQHPGGPLAAAVIAEAAGVPAVAERLVVMPDSPRLGPFREEFAGMVGSFFAYPQPARGDVPGFLDAEEIIDHEALYARLRADHRTQVDVKAYLRCRLLDILLGDFDRHRKQWRWAKRPGRPALVPIPEDRDQAFVRYDGFGQRLGAVFVPILQNYGKRSPAMRGLVLHGWEQDRWLLPALGWADWVEIVDDLQARITDDVIERALQALPPEYAALDGPRFRRDVRGRRDRLRSSARQFYLHLAGEVDVQGTDADERVRIRQAEDGAVTVEAWASSSTVAWFQRRFLPNETNDVRVYLRGGDDTVEVIGEPGPVQVRLIAEGGDKAVDDRRGKGLRVYDEQGAVEVRPGTGTAVNRDRYVPPPSDSGFVDVEGVPPRDWGSETLPVPLLAFDHDMGFLIGGGVVHTRYGFRTHPWRSRHRFVAGWSTGANRVNIDYDGAFRFAYSRLEARLGLDVTGVEVLRFHGFGNETRIDGPDDLYRVPNQRYRATPSVALALFDDALRLEAGPWLDVSRTADDDERLVHRLEPYGSGAFFATGAFGRLQFDLRRTIDGVNPDLVLARGGNPAAGYPTRGILLDLTAKISPPVLSVEEVWGAVDGTLTGFFDFWTRGRFVAAARVGAKQVLGRAPYFEAAYLGGGSFFSGASTLRGFRAQRYAGDAAVFGSLDLRLALFRFDVLLPGDFGLTAFSDVGRVFEDEPTSGPGASSRRWHPSVGGGLWFAPLARVNTFSLTAAHSAEEAVLVYFRAGFHY